MQKINSLLLFLLIALLFTQCSKEDVGTSPASEYALDGRSFAPSASAPSGGGNTTNPTQPGVITAGEWNDIQHWNFWTDLLKKEDWAQKQDNWEMYLQKKYTVVLTDQSDLPVYDAKVTLEDQQGNAMAEARTDNSGIAVLFPELTNNKIQSTKASGMRVKVLYDSQVFYLGNVDAQKAVFGKQLDINRKNYQPLDILFAVDATGSMGDEMSYLKTELNDVINRVKAQSAHVKVRLGSVFYRDEGDEYVTRAFQFTDNISNMLKNMNAQEAGGGGDFPEAVDAALENAIFQQNWSENAVGRIVFLILDAPPHHTPETIRKLQKIMTTAAKKGIKIIPITASGIDKETEFLMRAFAVSTNGTYVFITDHSGIGNDHLEPTVGEYEVEFLNNLMVRLIVQYSNTGK